MAKFTLILACGHELDRALRGDRAPRMDGGHIACPQCKRLQPVDRFTTHADDDDAGGDAAAPES